MPSASATISSLPVSLSLRLHNSRATLLCLATPSPLSINLSTLPKKEETEWRLLCLRHENVPSENNGSESKDELAGDFVKPKGDKSKELNENWLLTLHK
ncbi:hypothetical protein PIB30_097839, partial [Stylosanthes scabra]|nr:hypothetical protein [Stylosanthes scabra]